MPLSTECLEAVDGDPWLALTAVITITRLRMIARGELEPLPGEQLPAAVLRERALLAA